MKNKYCILMVTLFLMSCIITTAQVTIFKEDFSTAGSRWSVYSNDKNQFAIYNGKGILWDFDPSFSGARIEKIGTDLDINTDFSVSVKATFTGGENSWGYGLVFGANSSSPTSGYKFLIAASGYYCLSKWVNGSTVELIKWVKIDIVKKDPFIQQKLEVRKQGSNWLLLIDDQQVNTYPAQSLYGNYIGLVKDNKQRVEFDDLELVDLAQSNQPAVVYNNDCEAFTALKKLNASKGFGSIRGSGATVESDGFIGHTYRFPSKQSFPGAQKTYILADSDSKTYTPEKSEKHYLEAVYASGLNYQTAQEQFPAIQKKLADCLKEYHFNPYSGNNGKVERCTISEKINGGYKSTSDALSIVKDPFKSGAYMISLRIYTPSDNSKEVRFINNTPIRNSDFAKSLMQVIGYAETRFEGKKGSKIDGAGFMATRYGTTIKVSGALDNYIEDMLGSGFYAVMEKNISEQAIKAKMTMWHQKLIQVLGNEYHYTESTNNYVYDHAKKSNAPYLSLLKEKSKDGNSYSIIIEVRKEIEIEDEEEDF